MDLSEQQIADCRRASSPRPSLEMGLWIMLSQLQVKNMWLSGVRGNDLEAPAEQTLLSTGRVLYSWLIYIVYFISG